MLSGIVTPEEHKPLADLLSFLESGERLAHECARAQTNLAPTKKMQQFLEGQATQEALHATVFRTARRWMAPGHQNRLSSLEPFEEYTALLQSALKRRDFLESILAEQVILEGLGEAILFKLEDGLQKRNAPFRRLRMILLHQEAAHHRFGERVLAQATADKTQTREELCQKAAPYLDLCRDMIMGLHPLFEEINENPHEYLAIHHGSLPHWLVPT